VWFGYTAQARPSPAGLDPMGYGVIGSPTGSGPVSLGSSPGTPAMCSVRLPVRVVALRMFGWQVQRVRCTQAGALA